MFHLIGLPVWPWLFVWSLIGAALGVLVSWRWPGGVLRTHAYEWRPLSGGLAGVFAGVVFAKYLITSPLVVLPVAFSLAWAASRRPDFSIPQFIRTFAAFLMGENNDDDSGSIPEQVVERMVFRSTWNSRPRFETYDPGQFVGRNELIGRISSHFISKSGGTILISGVRGVGKTALVDRSLVEARSKLSGRYWDQAAAFLEKRAKIWHPIDLLVRHNLAKLGEFAQPPSGRSRGKNRRLTGEQARWGAQGYADRQRRRYWKGINPVRRRIMKMYTAAHWQLLVLKFSASDIAGALADPDQKLPDKPQIDPEKLLRSVIRKLYTTCHTSSPRPEAEILQWSLWNKKRRQQFFDNLQKAYDKSISKSYKEVIQSNVSDFVKQQWNIDSETKLNVVIIVALVGLFLLLLGLSFTPQGVALLGSLHLPASISASLGKVINVLTGAVAILASTIIIKWSRSSGSDRNRQAQFSYENDYSLERMQSDFESLLQALYPPNATNFNPYQCFTRSVIVFDELDKLDNADKQLDDVITYFKNFFTLSNSMFVFLTDHKFYEHLTRETIRAQQARHYSPQHTFFTEKIYLRKPEFSRFREAFYGFANVDWLIKRVASLPSDPSLIDFVFSPGTSDLYISSLPLPSLTYLYIHRYEYEQSTREAIEAEFQRKEGRRDPLALAQIWASQAASDADTNEMKQTEADFRRMHGWSNMEAAALLCYCKDDFLPEEQEAIANWYKEAGEPPLTFYESVKGVPFSLGDLAQALCFQTRNHYFDLYQFVYDYVSDYADDSPIILMEDKRFAQETRLASRYQRLIEIAFNGFKETHPSREYFNSLLMESLYAVFDKRASARRAKVTDVLLRTNGQRKTKVANDAKPLPSENDLPIYDDRDARKINEAITRLLELAFAHKAISSEASDFEERLKTLNPAKLTELQFEWNDDVCSVIQVTQKEAYEHELIRFWHENKAELEALEAEMALLWKTATMPEESMKMRAAIRELRSKTEAMKLASLKVSESDAELLKASVLTAEGRKLLLAKMILGRIRTEEDAAIIQDASDMAKTPAAGIDSRKRELETVAGVKVQAAIVPHGSECCVFLISAQPPTQDQKWRDFPKDNEFILWFTSAKDELKDGDRIWFYYPPPNPSSAATLFDDYCYLATQWRIQRIGAHITAANYKDNALARRAGAEAVGFIGSGSAFQVALSEPVIDAAIRLLEDSRKSIDQYGAEFFWGFYLAQVPTSGIDAISKVSEYVATKALGEAAASSDGLPFALKPAIEESLKDSLGSSASDLSTDAWVRVFTSGSAKPEVLSDLIFSKIIQQLAKKQIEASTNEVTDAQLPVVAVREFLPWLTQAINDLAAKNNMDLKEMFAAPDWANELEKQRRSLGTPLLPPHPSPRRTFALRRRPWKKADTT